MYMITNEQANALLEMVKAKVVKGEERERLIAEIESHKLTYGDMLRQEMSDEDFATLIQKDGCINCPLGGLTGDCELAAASFNFTGECYAAILRLLKAEVKDNDD